MTKSGFRLGPGVVLPKTAVAEKLAIIATSGGGKSYTMSLLVERMVDAGVQVVVLDPVGIHYGLRIAADGKRPGLPVYVLGGLHGDLPLEPGTGGLVAKTIYETGASFVLDVSVLRKKQREQWVAEWAEAFYETAKHYQSPVHVFYEEFHKFAPQFAKGKERMLGAVEDICRLGRNFGIGWTGVTQRPQSANKEVLNQADYLLLLRTRGKHERKAIEEWVDEWVDPEIEEYDVRADLKTVPRLPVGEGFFWNPGAGVYKRVKVDEKKTYDASRAIKQGKVPTKRSRAKVDLGSLEGAMKEAVEAAKENDPGVLKKRIAELEKELAKKAAAAPAERVEVPVLSDGDRATLESLEKSLLRAQEAAAAVPAELLESVKKFEETVRAFGEVDLRPALVGIKGSPAEVPVATSDPPRPSRATNGSAAVTDLTPYQQAIIDAVALAGKIGIEAPTREQVAFLARKSHTSSTFERYVSALSGRGLLQTGRGTLRLTRSGLDRANPPPETPNEAALREEVFARLTPYQARLLRSIVDAYPESISREDVAEVAGVSTTSSTFERYMSHLASLGLVEKTGPGFVKAASFLFFKVRELSA